MKSAFDKIMAGIADVTTYAKGDDGRARVIQPVDIKAGRLKPQ